MKNAYQSTYGGGAANGVVMKLSPSRPGPVIAVAPTAAPNPAKVGQSVAFSARATDPLGRALTYRWNFGDYDSGSIGTGTAPAHTYTAAGTYQASVTVSDGQGGMATADCPVTVAAGAPPILAQPSR